MNTNKFLSRMDLVTSFLNVLLVIQSVIDLNISAATGWLAAACGSLAMFANWETAYLKEKRERE